MISFYRDPSTGHKQALRQFLQSTIAWENDLVRQQRLTAVQGAALWAALASLQASPRSFISTKETQRVQPFW